MKILTALALTVLLPMLWVDSVVGLYEIDITHHSYLNPTGRCDECREDNNPDPGCCDEATIRPINDTCPAAESCDTAMIICFRPVDSTEELTGVSCRNTLTGIMTLFPDTNHLDFSLLSTFFGFPNPYVIFGGVAWVGIQLLYVVVECSQNQSFNCDIMQRIDAIPVDIDITVGTASPETTYIGSAGIAQLNVSFIVRCTDGFYGQDCLTSCPDFESCAGCGLSGFTGEFCQFSCSEVYCNGNGDCVDGNSTCDCNPGFTGDDCQVNIDDCEGVSCNNSGECIDRIDGFECDCNPGFTGDLCQVNIDDCEGVSCNNSVECIDRIDGFECDCNPGFTGDICQVNIDDCEGVSCNNSGECIDRINGFECDCNPGFTGELCQNIDDCEGVSCNNSGECIDQTDGFACECDLGFTGDFCQHNIDDCEDVNCNDGWCLDELNSFTCQCNPGFFGDACENTDHCFGITCSGNGRCDNQRDTFTCTCETGYTGDQCQETILDSDGVSIGAIAGGVIIGVVVLAIIVVMAIILALSRARKSEGGNLEENTIKECDDTKDNPAHNAQGHAVDNSSPYVAQVSATAHAQDSSVPDREFENPLYTSNMDSEDPYAVPSESPSPPNVYDRVGPREEVYYSTIAT